MADYKKLVPFIRKWEGGFVNDPLDKGGATNKGVTIGTFIQFYGKDATVEQLKNMTDEQWMHMFKSGYWDRWIADRIINQSVANILVDWVWASGVWGIKIPQRLLNVAIDGVVGTATLAALNSKDACTAFDAIMAARLQFIDDICRKTPTNERFRRGWINRLNDIKFED